MNHISVQHCPATLYLTLLRAKPAGVIRIYVLGDSAAQGVPNPTFGFGRVLEVMLRDRYPGAKFEIVNAAMTAINSHVTLEIAEDCAAHQPDLFVVYMGNNEVIGPYGPGTVFEKWNPSLSLIRMNLRLKSARTGQLFVDAMSRLRPEKGDLVWRGMEMFTGNAITADDPRLAGVYDNLRRNLSDICRVGRRAGAGVILSTLAVNLKDCPPFASRHRPDLSVEDLEKWKSEFQAGIELEDKKLWPEALAKYASAARFDDRFAELRFRMGRCFAAQGRYKEAHDNFVAARDLDALRFRADTKINQVIREVALAQKADGVYGVDAEQSLAAIDSTGIPGKELFYEHVHFTLDGNYRLALAVLEQVEAALPQLAAFRGKNSVLSMQRCREALVFTPWDEAQFVAFIAQLIFRPPFTGQLDHAARLAEVRQLADGLRRASSRREAYRETRTAYLAAQAKTPEDWLMHHRLGQLLLEGGELELAAEQLYSAQRKYPWESSLYVDLGNVEHRRRRDDRAAMHYRKALEFSPNDLLATTFLGVALAGLGRIDEAMACYQKVLAIDPDYEYAHISLATALVKQGRIAEAVARFQKALDKYPGNASTHYRLGVVFAGIGRTDAAISAYEKALELDPDNEPASVELGEIFAREGRAKEAIAHLRKAVDINPDNADAQYSLGIVLAGAGQTDEAIAAYRKTLELVPGNESARISLGIALALKGRLDDAIEQFRKTVEINPGNAIAFYNLGRLLAASGRTGEAADSFRQALKINPDFGDARESLQSLTAKK